MTGPSENQGDEHGANTFGDLEPLPDPGAIPTPQPGEDGYVYERLITPEEAQAVADHVHAKNQVSAEELLRQMQEWHQEGLYLAHKTGGTVWAEDIAPLFVAATSALLAQQQTTTELSAERDVAMWLQAEADFDDEQRTERWNRWHTEAESEREALRAELISLREEKERADASLVSARTYRQAAEDKLAQWQADFKMQLRKGTEQVRAERDELRRRLARAERIEKAAQRVVEEFNQPQMLAFRIGSAIEALGAALSSSESPDR